jgi:hypothetical protein
MLFRNFASSLTCSLWTKCDIPHSPRHAALSRASRPLPCRRRQGWRKHPGCP